MLSYATRTGFHKLQRRLAQNSTSARFERHGEFRVFRRKSVGSQAGRCVLSPRIRNVIRASWVFPLSRRGHIHDEWSLDPTAPICLRGDLYPIPPVRVCAT